MAPGSNSSKKEVEAAAWEISRHGVNEMLSETYGQENAFYYSLSAILARENVMLDGPGGGAKTLAIRKAFDAQIRAVKSPQDRKEIDAFKRELMNVIWNWNAQQRVSATAVDVQTGVHVQIPQTRLIQQKEITENSVYSISTSRTSNKIEIKEKASGRVRFIQGPENITGISLSPNGKYIAVASRDKLVRIYKIPSATPIHTIVNEHPLQKAYFSADSKTVISVLALPEKQVFTQQLHATISETKFLGGPDPFKFVTDGKFEIDFSKALISDKNMYAILDELEKAPVALQMTLLSILNERQALVGNKIVQTALESVAATTNATLGKLISDAAPHEVGGRKAMVDRFAVKVHIVNVSESARADYLMVEKVNAAKGQNRFIIIDLRNLNHLINQVEVSKEVLETMTDISLHMDRFYTAKLNRAYEELEDPKEMPKYYPAFSGSTRSQGKVPRLWKSAFIIRQLMQGVPHASMDLTLNSKDFIDIAPAILHGGPDYFIPENGIRVPFFLNTSSLGNPVMVGSLSKNARRNREFHLSEGIYDPNTGIFSYISSTNHSRHYLRFDHKSGKLVILDPSLKNEILFDTESAYSEIGNPFWDRYKDIEQTLQLVHDKKMKFSKNVPDLQYKASGRLYEFLNGGEAPLRRDSKAQLAEIEEAQNEFLSIVNAKVKEMAGAPKTKLDAKPYLEIEAKIEARAQELRKYLSQAIRSNNRDQIELGAAASLVSAYKELSYRFIEASSNVKGLLVTMMNHKNAMMFGPPGSGKTLMVRTIFAAEIEFMSDAQAARANSVLSEELLKHSHGEHSIWVKQFHPMSNEGDVVGRIDLKQVRDGKGYAYNRTGSLSSKDVLLALLDEFEKAPPGVKTSLLSLLNERQLMDGDEVVLSNLIAVVINTNATPGQFMTGLGDFSTAFPVYDRIHQKIYSVNKLTDEGLRDFHRRLQLGIGTDLKIPLFTHPLYALTKTYQTKIEERALLSNIHQKYMKEVVEKSETEREMFEGQQTRDYFMNSRGESNRSVLVSRLTEFPGVATLSKILDGKKPSDLRAGGNRFDLADLQAFGELYLTYNGFYSLGHEFDSNGMIHFKVIEKDLSSIMDRIDPAEKKAIEDFKFEHETMAQVLNHFTQKFIAEQKAMIMQNPDLYPSLFASKADREAWKRLHQQNQ